MKNKKIQQLDMTGQPVGEIELPGELFDASVSPHLMAQYVRVHHQRRALGTKKTKNRGEVQGGGRKPWRQKGLGRARHGSIRSPIWVGGGHAHALTPRMNSRVRMSRAMRLRALASGLTQHLADRTVYALTDLSLSKPETKQLATAITGLGLAGQKVLFVTPTKDPVIEKSAANLPGANVMEARLLNAYTTLVYPNIVLVGDAHRVLAETYVSA